MTFTVPVYSNDSIGLRPTLRQHISVAETLRVGSACFPVALNGHGD